tara:strand:+ start:1684 stop:3171 length:1488 start_codon:yes stop_codon:yes gene_type:complete
MKNIKRIGVVGGGSSGFIAALMLRTRFPNHHIDIICSKKLGIIGVGEGSTEHWTDFAEYVGLRDDEMISECNATFKIGIMFEDWGVDKYMHSIQDGYNLELGSQYPFVFANMIKDDVHSDQMSNKGFWENKINNWYIENNQVPVAQFHFDTFKLNEYLTSHAGARGINIIDDEITKVNHDDEGNISTIESDTATYDYDFYIDCTGMRRVLMSTLGAKWESHKEYLHTNSAIVFQTPDTDNYNMWSLAKGMKHGWMFRTPTYGRWGNGYIFDSEYLTPEGAKAEVEEVLGHEITIGKHIKFDPGALDNAWIKNCCAIGLSSSFIEPLEASSIGSSIQQMFMLVHNLHNYNDDTVDRYNRSFKSLIENIRDFIVLHFVCPRVDTEFWRKVADTPLPKSLQTKLDIWRHRMPTHIDFDDDTNFILFKSLHFVMVLHGLKLFDIDSIGEEYATLHESFKQKADEVREHLNNESHEDHTFLTHKEFLTMVRKLHKETTGQ